MPIINKVPIIPVIIPKTCLTFQINLKKITAIIIVKTGTREFNMPVAALLNSSSANAKRKAGMPFPKNPEINR